LWKWIQCSRRPEEDDNLLLVLATQWEQHVFLTAGPTLQPLSYLLYFFLNSKTIVYWLRKNNTWLLVEKQKPRRAKSLRVIKKKIQNYHHPRFLFFFLIILDLFPPSLLTWVFLIYTSIVIPLLHFWANIPITPSPLLLYGCSPPNPPLITTLLPNNHIHWGFSLGRTKGFPFHWCSY